MKKTFFLFIAVVLSGGFVFAQNNATTITFVNTGKMFIGGDATHTALYVPDAVRMLDASTNVPEILMKYNGIVGRWDIGGNFYQDSYYNVFKPSPDGFCYGMVRFVTDRGVERYIKPLSTEPSFDRSASFVSFPTVVLETNDTVTVPAQMGIDVLNAHKINNGRLLLKSEDIGGKVYDASLRVRENIAATSSAYVDPGMVIVEKWVRTYRLGTQLFGFATPFFNTQKSGYFAGNWVRKPERGANMHTEYYLGNKPSPSNPNVIHLDQFVIDPNIKFDAGRAYIIEPRPPGFDYQLLKDKGLWITDDDPPAYDKDKFVFNGKVYQLPLYTEQLYAEDNLPILKLDGGTATTVATNWLIGNSYTCAISLDALGNYLGGHTLNFSPIMYVFPAGSTTYQPYDFREIITLYNMTEIPAMSIFMVRPNKNQSSTAQFKIDKSMLVHSTVDYGQTDYVAQAPGRLRAPHSGLNNQVIFRLTTADNENNYDLSAIGLRVPIGSGTNAIIPSLGIDNGDIPKVYMGEKAGFQLYTLSAPDAVTDIVTKLSINCVPLDVVTVPMNIKPMAYEPKTMILSVEGVETLTSPDFWIEDLMTGAKHRFVNGEPYVFSVDPDDEHERFLVHFDPQPIPTDIDDPLVNSKLNMFAIGKEIFIENLLPSDIGAKAEIYDVAGRLLDAFKITEQPKMSYLTNGLISGTYIMRLFRNNSVETMKLIIR